LIYVANILVLIGLESNHPFNSEEGLNVVLEGESIAPVQILLLLKSFLQL
jgi:hypothetical protein